MPKLFGLFYKSYLFDFTAKTIKFIQFKITSNLLNFNINTFIICENKDFFHNYNFKNVTKI